MLEEFKTRWEISQNWQLVFPFLGIIGLAYSAYRIVFRLTESISIVISILLTVICFWLLLKLTLFIFKKLENKWIVDSKWEMIRIFIVFALTGSSSVFVGRPFMKLIGITKENLNPVLYWLLFIIIGLIFYQVLLVCLGWLFGQGKFFWEFEKKMLRRFGLKKLID